MLFVHMDLVMNLYRKKLCPCYMVNAGGIYPGKTLEC